MSGFNFILFLEQRSYCSPYGPWTHSLAKAGLELTIFLPPLPETKNIGICHQRIMYMKAFVFVLVNVCVHVHAEPRGWEWVSFYITGLHVFKSASLTEPRINVSARQSLQQILVFYFFCCTSAGVIGIIITIVLYCPKLSKFRSLCIFSKHFIIQIIFLAFCLFI